MFARGRRGAARDAARSERPVVGRLTPVDVQGVQFRLAFRGYNEDDVDAFLDRVTEELTARIEERERLAGGEAPSTGGADLATARAEADAIVARARAEANEILRSAMAQAAGLGSGNGADARASLAPFLNREREFLGRIGEVVQTHAEEIRAMVLALRASGAPGANGAASEPTEARSQG